MPTVQKICKGLWFWDIPMEITIVPICSVGPFFALTETARFILFHQPTNFQHPEQKVILTMPYPKNNIYITPPHINAPKNTSPKILRSKKKHVNNQFIIKARVWISWTAPQKHLGLSERPHWNLNGPIHLWSNQQTPKLQEISTLWSEQTPKPE